MYKRQAQDLPRPFTSPDKQRAELRLRRELSVERLDGSSPVSYTHLRAHETVLDLVCRLLLEKTTTPQDKSGASSSGHTNTNLTCE